MTNEHTTTATATLMSKLGNSMITQNKSQQGEEKSRKDKTQKIPNSDKIDDSMDYGLFLNDDDSSQILRELEDTPTMDLEHDNQTGKDNDGPGNAYTKVENDTVLIKVIETSKRKQSDITANAVDDTNYGLKNRIQKVGEEAIDAKNCLISPVKMEFSTITRKTSTYEKNSS